MKDSITVLATTTFVVVELDSPFTRVLLEVQF